MSLENIILWSGSKHRFAKSEDEGPGMNALCYEEQEAWEGSHKFIITTMKSTDTECKLGNVDYMKVMYTFFYLPETIKGQRRSAEKYPTEDVDFFFLHLEGIVI